MDPEYSACKLRKKVMSSFKNKGSKLTFRCLDLLHIDSFRQMHVMSLGNETCSCYNR